MRIDFSRQKMINGLYGCIKTIRLRASFSNVSPAFSFHGDLESAIGPAENRFLAEKNDSIAT
jgi:hypothetical protein